MTLKVAFQMDPMEGLNIAGHSSFALMLAAQARGYRVRIRKFDPYLNVDPGTMSPYQHGEVYVTDDGAETDLDLGHYERFTGVSARQSDNITSGRIYQTIIQKERRGDYLGATVQVIPHVTDAIKEFAKADTQDLDFVLCEIGGTVGDIEALPYIESVRQLRWELGKNCVSIHLTLVPFLKATGELKTKPTQHSVKMLQESGVQPDILVCRSEHELGDDIKRKLALFCNVFCPNTTTPLPGNVAIGFTFASYKVSLLPDVNFLSALTTLPKAPLSKPAGANHGSDEASVNA